MDTRRRGRGARGSGRRGEAAPWSAAAAVTARYICDLALRPIPSVFAWYVGSLAVFAP